MTCIVGLEHPNGVWLGCCSGAVCQTSFDKNISLIDKVFFNDNSDMLFGFCGSFRAGQIVRYSFNIPDHDPRKSNEAYMASDFINAFRECLRENGCAKVELNEESTGESDFLCAYRNTLWFIASDYQVNRSSCGYYAIGSGAHYALGALAYLTDNTSNVKPETMVTKALEAAAKHNAGVMPPFKVLCLKP